MIAGHIAYIVNKMQIRLFKETILYSVYIENMEYVGWICRVG